MVARRTRHHDLPAKLEATSRRGFLRRAGVVAALSAAAAGGAELVGLSAVAAGTPKSKSTPETCCRHCVYEPGKCNSGNPCAPGYCCFYCNPTSGNCIPTSYWECIPNHCKTFSQCGTGF
jgi:hypothetical protein